MIRIASRNSCAVYVFGIWLASASAAGPQTTSTIPAPIRAKGQGAPYLFLRDGERVSTTYIGESSLARSFASSGARPLALASADFDEDGVPDLVSGYAAADGTGAIAIHRGNVDALWPYGKATRAGEAPAFLPQARVFSLPEAPDFLGVGDFDADGHWDIVAAALGGKSLYFLRGDGHGGFAAPERIDLPGAVTAFTTGEINRVDGLTDLAVAVQSTEGAQVLVFESPRGALRAKPEAFPISVAANALAMLPLDDDSFNDLAIGAGNQLLAIHGRDRMLSHPKTVRDSVPAAEITQQSLPFAVRSLASGRFTTASQVLDLAALGDDGKVHILERPDADYQAARAELPVALGAQSGLPAPGRIGKRETNSLPAKPQRRELTMRDEVRLPSLPSADARLIMAHTSITGADDILLADRSASYLRVISRNPNARSMRLAASLETASGDSAEGAPAAVLPMRLNRSPLHSLIVLQGGRVEPTAVRALAQSTFTVTNTQDPGPGQFNTDNESIPGSLRWAISSAIDAGGTSVIDFNIPVTDPNYNASTGTFTFKPLPNTNCGGSSGVPCQGLPPLPPGCVLDGYTQPGGTLNGITQPPASPNTLANGDNAVVKIVINGASAGQGPDGIWLFNGTGTVRGLIVNGFNSAINPGGLTSTGGFGINADSGGNFVEGNFLGVDSTGTTAIPNYVGTGGFGGPNVIGGTTPQARNLLSGNTYTNFGAAVSSTPNTYLVQGNYIGTDRTGTQSASFHGGLVEDGVAMVIGGATAGAGNLVSGNSTGMSINYPAGNPFTPDSNLVQGNLIGTDPTGTAAVANFVGVYVDTGTGNLIGGTTPALRNVVAGNFGDGVQLQQGAQQTTVQGNYIGVDSSGSKKLSNGGMGINNGTTGNLVNAYNTVVGGESGGGNVISANGVYGIQFGGGAGPLAATVLGNWIGTDATGVQALGNGAAGISIFEGASSIVIGGTDTPAGNVIAFNKGAGVIVDPATQALGQVGGSDSVIGNSIYSNTAAGVAIPSGTGNLVSQNSIYSNAGLGIDVDATGHLVNSACQASTSGGNALQNAPVLTAAGSGTTVPVSATATDPSHNTSEFSNCAPMALSGSTLNVVGTLNSLKNTSYTIEFFQNAACDVSGFGQGKTFLSRLSVTTDNNCNASFGDALNVTTADVGVSLSYNSSLFSTTVTPGQSFTYIATVQNNGTAAAANVSFTDTLPAGESFVSATTTQGTCNASGSPLTCSVGTLASGATAKISINVTINAVGAISDTATVSTTTPDPVSGNNSSTLNLTSDYSPAIIDHLSPAAAVAGSGPLALTIFGIGFYQGVTTATANTSTTLTYTLLNNQNCGTVFSPSTCQGLQVTIPTGLTASPGTITIAVSNPGPGGNTSFGPDTQSLVIYPNPGTVTQFQLTGLPNPALQNTSYNLTVTALDAASHVVPGYRGIVTLQDTFGSAAFTPPSPYTFTAGDSGAHVFSTQFSFPGADTITVTDAGTPSITASQDLNVNPLLGPPARLVGGQTPDNVPIGFPFPEPLSVTVLDASGNFLPGISVTFTAIAAGNGASGTFSNGQGSIVLQSDSNGAISTVLTANQTAGQFQVNATVGGLTAQWFPTSTVNVPAHITIVDGNPQSGPINTQFAGLLDVMVTDAQNNPVPSVPVTFTAPGSGASLNLTSTTAITSKFAVGFVQVGEARLDPIGVANATAGTYQLTASVGSVNVKFNFTNTPTAPAVSSMSASGTPQVAAVLTKFASNLGIVPRDSNGNCLAQIPITFSAPSTGASATFSTNTATSDPITCLAQVTATANAVAGSYTVTATAPGGVTQTFALTNTSGQITLTATGGTPQSTAVSTSFINLLQVNLVDSHGSPIAGATVNFTAPVSGASAAVASSATTDSSGNAGVIATANGTIGTYTVTASYGSATAAFRLTNTPAPAILSIHKTHTGSFGFGQNGTYNVTVSSSATGGPTDGTTVTVADYVPPGLTLVSMSGTGWNCPAGDYRCTRSDVLLAGQSYPSITVTVNVTAGGSLTNQAGVSGGGSNPANASDLTSIALSACDLNQDGVVNAADVQISINQSLGTRQFVNDLTHDSKSNVVDAQILINAAKNLGCSAQ